MIQCSATRPPEKHHRGWMEILTHSLTHSASTSSFSRSVFSYAPSCTPAADHSITASTRAPVVYPITLTHSPRRSAPNGSVATTSEMLTSTRLGDGGWTSVSVALEGS